MRSDGVWNAFVTRGRTLKSRARRVIPGSSYAREAVALGCRPSPAEKGRCVGKRGPRCGVLSNIEKRMLREALARADWEDRKKKRRFDKRVNTMTCREHERSLKKFARRKAL